MTQTHTSSQHTLASAKTIVVKIGSALLYSAKYETLRHDWFSAFAKDITNLSKQGKRIAIVSSGGIALGRTALGISKTMSPSKIPLMQKQAASAIGQPHMYNAYWRALKAHNMTTAQVLLTLSDTENRRTHLNARATLETLLESGIIPIINENDSTSTEEIRFGDNDRLAVRIGQMINAEAVVLMSTIDGLYTANPNDTATAKHIPVIEKITQDHANMAQEAKPGLSTGGMKSKIEAAINATQTGIPLIITNGEIPGSLGTLTDGTSPSTLFCPTVSKKSARKIWIGTHLNPKGCLTIDKGAITALRNGKSLLPIGVTHIEGTFDHGDIVRICGEDGTVLGTGISGYSSEHAQKIIGKKGHAISQTLGFIGRNELIHRNDLAFNTTDKALDNPKGCC